ncbi:recombinase family protein [Desulforamulus ferrireducens]|uniref:Resolvase n=1 Tax=Desulforamulus ferrireducens TaxID=1833852 RepID=A0A1S6IZJ0_9FIRM|nr:recombinase family protein [Desulforamulus ferrireducens]AQS60191.1 hypothetical protein B0537_14550 [Desulforamulus ferrireducens]
MKKAACYIRVSTDEQAEQGISIPAQKSRLLAYCQAQGWEVYDFFIDDGYSGKDLQRPGMQRMLTAAKNKHFNIVLVLKLDRLSRKQRDVLYLLEDIFEPNDIGFKSATESFDTTNAFGKASLGMMAVFAQLERDTIIERVRLAKKESAKQGRFLGGTAPYGYHYNHRQKRLEIDPVPAQIIKWIYQQYREGTHSYSTLAAQLELSGVPGPTNRAWNKQYVRKILTNPVYAGFVKHQGVLYVGAHAPIIEPAVWQEVQALVQCKGIGSVTNASLLSGIIWCGECGARMRTKNVWQNYPCTEPKRVIKYYVCYSQDGAAKHMVKNPGCRCGYKKAAEIEAKVIEQLQQYSFNHHFIVQVVEEILQRDDNKPALLQTISSVKKELVAINKKINKWYDAYEKEILEPEQLRVRINELNHKKKYTEQLLSTLEHQLTDDEEINSRQIVSMISDFAKIWAEATAAEQHEIVINLVKKVTVFADNTVELEFN